MSGTSSSTAPVIIPLRSIQIGSTQLVTGSAPVPTTPIPHIIVCSILQLSISSVGIAICYQGRNDATITTAVVTTWPPVKAKKS